MDQIAADDAVISTDRLTKHFKHIEALTDISVDIMPGEVVGLLGPNGSGKSTLVRLLMGFLKPSAGSARIMNLDCSYDSTNVHRHVAYLPGDARLFRTMRGIDVLKFFASFRGEDYFSRGRTIARRLDLDLSRWVAFMSTGMRQKLALAVVLALDAPVIILDEPTSNLDPSIRNEVLALVSEAKSCNQTVIFSSHVLSEIEQVCTRVLILRDGKLVHQQAIPDAADTNQQHQVRIVSKSKLNDLPEALAERTSIQLVQSNETSKCNEWLLTVDGKLNDLLGWLSQQSAIKVQIQPVDLQAVYERIHRSEE